MRPCGPVRGWGGRPALDVSKSGVIELLQNDDYSHIDVYEDGVFVCEYEQPASRIRTLLRKSGSFVSESTGQFAQYRKEGYKSTIVGTYEQKRIYVIRQIR